MRIPLGEILNMKLQPAEGQPVAAEEAVSMETKYLRMLE
jgi:hypothetical protein